MIKTKEDLRYYLQEDKAVNKSSNCSNRIKDLLFPNPIMCFLRNLRYLEYYENNPSLKNKIPYLYFKIRFRRISLKLGFSIPTNVFGPGLSIPHYGTIIVNHQARIGAYCKIHAGVNIGASAGKKEAPHLGDNIYIGPGAIIFGNIKICNNVTIGANATVNTSCDISNCVLAGTPAKIVKTEMPNWLYFNKVTIQHK